MNQMVFRSLAGVLAIVFLVWLLISLEPVLMPFFVGALFAYLGDPIADKLESWGCGRTLAVCLCFSVLLLLLVGAMLLLLPMAVHQLKVVYGQLPLLLQWIQLSGLPWLIETFDLEPEAFRLEALKDQVMSQWGNAGEIVSKLVQKATASTGSIVALVVNMALVPVVGFYLLRDWDILTAKFHRLLPVRFQSKAASLGEECNDVVGAFLRGQLWVMMALAFIYGFGLWIVGLKLALLVGLLAGLASIVPYLGFAVGIAAAMIAGVLQFDGLLPLVWIACVFLFGQVIESMVLTPVLVGDKIGLHPVAVIFAIMAGGQLFGFIGVILALPVAAVIVVILRHIHEIYKDTEFYSEN